MQSTEERKRSCCNTCRKGCCRYCCMCFCIILSAVLLLVCFFVYLFLYYVPRTNCFERRTQWSHLKIQCCDICDSIKPYTPFRDLKLIFNQCVFQKPGYKKMEYYTGQTNLIDVFGWLDVTLDATVDAALIDKNSSDYTPYQYWEQRRGPETCGTFLNTHDAIEKCKDVCMDFRIVEKYSKHKNLYVENEYPGRLINNIMEQVFDKVGWYTLPEIASVNKTKQELMELVSSVQQEIITNGDFNITRLIPFFEALLPELKETFMPIFSNMATEMEESSFFKKSLNMTKTLLHHMNQKNCNITENPTLLGIVTDLITIFGCRLTDNCPQIKDQKIRKSLVQETKNIDEEDESDDEEDESDDEDDKSKNRRLHDDIEYLP